MQTANDFPAHYRHLYPGIPATHHATDRTNRLPARDRDHPGSRFRRLFPWASRLVLNPGIAVPATVLTAAVLSFFSPHYALAAVTLGLAVVCIGWERRFLDLLLLTPNVLTARSVLMGGVVGCSYIASGLTDVGHRPALLAVQAAMLYWLVVSCLANRFFLADIPALRMPHANAAFTAECLRPLSLIASAILSLELIRQIVGLATGALDRGIYGDAAAAQAFGIWTYFSIFPRFTSTAMFLVPAIWRATNGPVRVAAMGLVGLLFLLGLSTGSRGLFLTPMVYLFVGMYFFLPIRRIPMDLVAGGIAATLTPFILVMATYRSTSEFRETPGWQVADRVRGFTRALTEPGDIYDKQWTAAQERLAFGTQMLGVSDQIVYEKTPQDLPYVGCENIDRILYVWIPKFFARDKPYLQDGNDIVVGYTGIVYRRSASTISLSADLYRRFTTVGVLLGVPLAALITAIFARWVFHVLVYRDALYGMVLLTLLASSFHVELWGTLLSSSFEWLYAIPKHLVFSWLLLIAARALTGAHAKRGLLAYFDAA